MRPRTILLLAGLLCACEPDPRNDAHLFLEQIERVDLDSPLEERRQLIDNIARLPLAAEEVARARDTCVRFHRTLIDVEDVHHEVQATLDRYQNDESAIPPRERVRLDSALARARTEIDQSHDLSSRCESATRNLRLRYRSR